MNESIPVTIAIKPRCGKRCKSGHPWIFSNEIIPPKPAPEPGCLTVVNDDSGYFTGYAHYNPHSLIALRILSRDSGRIPCTSKWFEEKIRAAAALRERFYPGRRSYRLIFGESDGLPGVVVDRYGEIFTVQILTAGMERYTETFLAAIERVCSPQAVFLRNDCEVRKLEGLPLFIKTAVGDIPKLVEIEEYGVRYLVDVTQGQKTGHFFDQAENRKALSSFVKGVDVLDLFCYTGGWSLHALVSGAKSATAIDRSTAALALAQQNAVLNQVDSRMELIEADVFEWLAAARREGRRFGAVIVDPPAFVKNAKQVKKALRGYEDVNRQAIHLTHEGGIFCSCSCSYLINEEQFLAALQRAAARERKQIRILEIRSQACDHPYLLSMPESRYLKCVIGIVETR